MLLSMSVFGNNFYRFNADKQKMHYYFVPYIFWLKKGIIPGLLVIGRTKSSSPYKF